MSDVTLTFDAGLNGGAPDEGVFLAVIPAESAAVIAQAVSDGYVEVGRRRLGRAGRQEVVVLAKSPGNRVSAAGKKRRARRT